MRRRFKFFDYHFAPSFRAARCSGCSRYWPIQSCPDVYESAWDDKYLFQTLRNLELHLRKRPIHSSAHRMICGDAPAVSIVLSGTVSGANVTITISFPSSAGTDTFTMVGTAKGKDLDGTYSDTQADAGSWTASTRSIPFGPPPRSMTTPERLTRQPTRRCLPRRFLLSWGRISPPT
jgi:hypothetical protein